MIRRPIKILTAALTALTICATGHATPPQQDLSTTRPLHTSTRYGGSSQPPRSGGITSSPSLTDLKIKLPFPAGKTYEIIQGNKGTYTHTGFNRYAWDFGLPLNSEVCAAASGRIVRVKQDGTKGGPSNEFFGQGNAIVIDHGNGYFTHYLHLAAGSARVAEGELVSAGTVIALSGNTGFSSTPHLHFHVQNASGQSLPVRFADVPGDGIPRENQKVTSDNNGTGTTQYSGESYLPANAFEANAIQLLTLDLPAHLYRLNRTYTLKGRIDANLKTDRVAVYLMNPAGGSPVFVSYAEVKSEGFFTASLNMSEVKSKCSIWSNSTTQSNSFSLALAPVQPDGTFWTDVSIPICIR